jgi:hypothetical protein
MKVVCLEVQNVGIRQQMRQTIRDRFAIFRADTDINSHIRFLPVMVFDQAARPTLARVFILRSRCRLSCLRQIRTKVPAHRSPR